MKNRTAKNSVIYFGGTAIMAVLGFVSTMFLTRILDTQVYAMYGLLSTFITAVTMFISFGYDSSYTRFYYSHNYTQKTFMTKCLMVPMLIFIVFAVVVLEPSHTFVGYIFEGDLSIAAIILMLLYSLFFFVHRFTQLTARMEERAINYIISNLIAKSGFIVFVCIFYSLQKTVSFEAIIFSFMVSSLVAILINVPIIVKNTNQVPEKPTGRVNGKALIQYGFPYMINDVFILTIPVVEKVIIRDLAGWEVLSIYTAAAIFQTVALLVSNTVVNIWNPIVFKHCDDEKYFKPILHSFGSGLTIIVALGLGACVLLRRWLILLLGSDYNSAYIIAPAIMFGALFNISAAVYGSGINIKKKTIHYVISPLIQIILSIALCYMTIPSMGLVGVGFATLISITISRLYRILVGLKLYGTGEREFKIIVIYAICFAVSALSLVYTSPLADVLMSMVLVLITSLLLWKDIIVLAKKGLLMVLKKS